MVPPVHVNRFPVVVVFNSRSHSTGLLKSFEIRACRRRHEIKVCDNYCLSALCPRFDTARKVLVTHLQSVGYCSLLPDDFSVTPYRCRPHERPESSGRKSFVAATYQSVRFARTLARYALRGRTVPFTYMCLSAQVSGRKTRVVAGTQDSPTGGAWMSVRCECCVLSRRSQCDELITCPEESYRLWCVVVCDLETS
jgi:hypothetical protein